MQWNWDSKAIWLERPRDGAMLVLVAFMLVILLVMTAFAVDVAYMQLVRTELRTSTDAAAKAASEALARTQDVNQARAAARQFAALNRVAGDPLQLADSDIIFGEAEQSGVGFFQFNPGSSELNSVRVLGRRTNTSPSGSVALFLGGILGRSTFEPEMASTSTGLVRDIALVLDRSGSMATTDAGGGLSRNQALINAVNDFITEVESSSPNSAISLVTYSTAASTDLNLTTNLNTVRNRVNSLGANGFTNLRAGLQLGSNSLEGPNARPFAKRTIVVMTDGNFNVGGTPVPSANVAAGRGHTIHTVTFSSNADQDIMRQVANIGDGLHFHADDADDLSEAFREIARTLAVVLID